MTDRWLPVALMFGAVAVWWTRPVVGAFRAWRRQCRWDRRREYDEMRRAFEDRG